MLKLLNWVSDELNSSLILEKKKNSTTTETQLRGLREQMKKARGSTHNSIKQRALKVLKQKKM